MAHRLLLSLFSLLALAAGDAAWAAAADEPLPALRDRVTQMRWQALVKRSELATLAEDQQLLKDAVPFAGNARTAAAEQFEGFWRAIDQQLRQRLDGRNVEVKKLAEELAKHQEDSRQAWGKAQASKARLEDRWVEEEGRLGVDLEHARGGFWAEPRTFAAWFGGGGLVLVGLLLALHEDRRRLRLRYRRLVSRAAAAAVAWLCLASPGCQGPTAPAAARPARLSADWAKQDEQLRAEHKALDADLAKARAAARQARAKLVETWVAALELPSAHKFAALADAVRQREHEAYDDFYKARVAAHVIRQSAKDAEAVARRVGEEEEQLQQRVADRLGEARLYALGQMGLAGSLTALAFTPLVLVRRRQRQAVQEQAELCPRCLAKGELEVKESPIQDERYPEAEYLVCRACEYDFRKSYQVLPRLCFPTVGVTASGKTHSLVRAYSLIEQRHVPVAAELRPALSVAAEEQFAVLVRDILSKCLDSHASQYELPVPLVYHLQDPEGGSALLNLFDYSGELMRKSVYSDVLKRRALLMDGFLLFLDATQVRDYGNGQDLTYQIKTLDHFKDDMREVRKLGASEAIDVPIAVCLSKLDLLVTKSPIGRRALPFLRELRKTYDTPVTLKTLQYRSLLCEQQLGVLFPGWNVKRTLEEAFGRRYLFFPMTPVNLEEAELGIEDLKQRSPVPFGVLEPILWLTHMHGYNILQP